MPLDQRILKDIEIIIQDECKIIGEYLSLLSAEQEHVIKLKSDQVASFADRRAAMTDTLAKLRAMRDDLVRQINGNTRTTLTELITTQGSAFDKKRFLPLIEKLKKRLAAFENKNQEFSQVIDFTLGLVNGSLSILWSATQTVTRCYNAFGAITESFQPTSPRGGSLLGRA
jgi:hypothetical protein